MNPNHGAGVRDPVVHHEHKSTVDLPCPVGPLLVGDQHRHSSELRPDPVGWRPHVHRQVPATCLEHSQLRDHEFQRAVHQQADRLLGPYAESDQPVRQVVGPAIQFAVAQRTGVALHGDGIRDATHLLGEALHDRVGGHLPRGVVPLHQDPTLFATGEHVHPPQRAIQVAGHLGQQHPQVHGELLDRARVEQRGVVAEGERQPFARNGHHAQGVVGGLHSAQLAKFQPELGGGRIVDRVVLEDQDAVEQLAAVEVLQPGQGDVLEPPGLGLPLLEIPQPAEQIGTSIHSGQNRQRGDEHAGDLPRASQLRRPTRNRGAEADRALAAVPGQQQRPGALDHRVQGQPVALRHLAQPGSGQLDLDPRGRLDAVIGQRCAVVGQRRALHPVGEHTAPVQLGGLLILPGQPVQVVAERPPGGQRGLRATVECRVAGEHVGQHLEQAPPVQHQVVEGPQDLHLGAGQPGQHEPHQGRGGQVEPGEPVLRHQCGEFRAPLFLGQRGPVPVPHGQLNLASHQLDRLVHALPDDLAAQSRSAVQHVLPRLDEHRRVGDPAEHEGQLLEVGALPVPGQPMHQHPALRGRQRVHVLDGPAIPDNPVHGGLVQARQREVRGRAATRARLRAVADDRSQHPGQVPGQGVDGLGVVQAVGVEPGELQAAPVDPADHLHLVRPDRVGTLRQVQFPGQAVVQTGRQVELAEVVEADRGPHLRRRTVQVVQRTVGQPPLGDGTQLFLHGFERAAPVLVSHLQRDREDAGEPAHRPGQVDPVEQVLAAVPLHLHQHALAPGPVAEHPAQRGEQHVVDLGPVHAGNLVEQRLRLLGRQPDRDRTRGPGEVGSGAVQRHRVVTLGGCPPVVQASGLVLRQPPRPLLAGCRPPAQLDRLAPYRLAVGVFQVRQQDAPGHSVHHEVVHGQGQHLGLDQHSADQRPGGQVELLVPPVQHLDRLERRDDLPPAGTGPFEPRPQRVVLPHQRGQRRPQRRLVRLLGQTYRERLDELLGPLRLGVQVPVLHRAQWHVTGDRSLGRPLVGGRYGHRREPGDRGMQEHVLGQQPQTRLVRPGHDLDAQDRIPAQLEEVVLNAHLRQAEHLGPDVGKNPFHFGARRHVTGAGVRGPVRSWQRTPVQFPVGVERKPVQQHERRWHHVIRQRLAEKAAQPGGVRSGTRRGHQVGDQPLVPGLLLPGHGDGLGHLPMPQQGVLHLAQLDPEPADLDLLVGAAEVVQLALSGPAHHVPGAVHACPRRTERVGDEPLRGQARPVEVAAGQRQAAQVQLAGYPGRHRAQAAVEHVRAGGAQRAADRRVPVQVGAVGVPGGGVHGGLGRAVDVGDPAAGQGCADLPHGAGGQRLAGQHDRVRCDRHGALRQQRGEGRGNAADQAGRPLGAGALAQRQHVAHQLDPTAAHQRAEQLEHGHVEVQRGGGHHLGESGGAELLDGPGNQAHRAAMRDDDTLGLPSRPRGVDDVGRVVRSQPDLAQIPVATVVQHLFVHGQPRHTVHGCQPVAGGQQ